MRFRLFGFPVEIQFTFWIGTFLFSRWQQGIDITILVWMAVVFVSILVHELGHAVAIRRHGATPEISLHWMGGTTSWRAVLPLRRRDHVIISLAGPGAGFLLAGLVLLVQRLVPATSIPPLGHEAIADLLWV